MWSTDITYVRLHKGFVYLTAIIDWYSRYVLSWRISTTLDRSFCIEALQEALAQYGNPEIFNTDQGCQYTSEAFTGLLKANQIKISMDGKGRGLGQCLCRTAVANRETRRSVCERLSKCRRLSRMIAGLL